ncbi:MAG: response regulator, partial [Caldilineae bacterium]
IDLTLRAFARHKLTNPILVARDGDEALQYVLQWEGGAPLPLLILLDLKLPKVDGLDVLRQIKAHPRFRTLPVVILTTSHDDRDVETAYRLGANSYIVKPVDFDRFMEVAAQLERYWLTLNTPPRKFQA